MMLSKCSIILLLVAFESRLISGEYFRKGYTYIEDLKSFYKFSTSEKTWSQAMIRCLREDATLFYPENEEEAQEIMSMWNTNYPDVDEILAGFSNWNVKEIYQTVDGRRASEVYNNWACGEPNSNDANQTCAIMKKDGTLEEQSCSHVYPYICKKTLATVEWNSDCNLPDLDYVYNEELDRCYKFHLYPQNWTDAYAVCDAEESYLAIINSSVEDQYLINITAAAPKDEVGGNYLRGAVHMGFYNISGYWETIQGVPLNESGYYWEGTQPDGKGQETCGSMFYTGQLNDIGCWQRMFFICEHEISSDCV